MLDAPLLERFKCGGICVKALRVQKPLFQKLGLRQLWAVDLIQLNRREKQG